MNVEQTKAFAESGWQLKLDCKEYVLLPGQTTENVDDLTRDFPTKITDWIWSDADSNKWSLACRLENGIYVLYQSEKGCSGGFFSYGGYIRISAAPTLIELFMPKVNYDKYISSGN